VFRTKFVQDQTQVVSSVAPLQRNLSERSLRELEAKPRVVYVHERHSPVAAALLSWCIFNCGGQFYNGQNEKAALLAGLLVFEFITGMVISFLTFGMSVLIALPLSLASSAISAADAYLIAQRIRNGEAVAKWQWF
jgi:hypothetical protein